MNAIPAGETVTVTFFANYAASTKREESLILAALAQRIRTTTAPTKEALPWLKLAKFGDRRTAHGSLRHNANVVAITGIEADYDAKQMSFEDAERVARAAGLHCLIYTSPSFTEDEPKWRVLCPLSAEHPAAERDRFMARLNGLFGGIFSRESWALSQGYYYGRVANPDHHATVFEGTPIDLADHLDAGAIGRPIERNVGQKAQPTQRPADIAEARIRGLVTALLDNIRAAKDGEKHHTLRDTCLTLGGYLHLVGWSVEEAAEQAIGALPSADDWDQARATARWGIEHGMANPLQMEDRPDPNSKQRNDPTDDRQSQDQEATERQPDDQQPPPGDWTHRWRAADGDHWVTPIGEPEPGSDGRQYVHVHYQGGGKQADGTPFPDGNSFVPLDELITRAEWEAEAAERAADFDARFPPPSPFDADDGYQASQDQEADDERTRRGNRGQEPPAGRWPEEPDPTTDEVEFVPATIRPVSTIPTRQWAYGYFLLLGTAAVIGALDGTGKGTIAVGIMLAFITGKPILGEKVWRTGKVAIVTYEDGQEEWERRFAAACLLHKLDYEQVMASVVFIVKRGGRVVFGQRGAHGGFIFPDSDSIIDQLRSGGFALLLVDPFNNAHAMEDGNNNVAIAAVAAEMSRIAFAAKVAILVLHHLRKGAIGDPDDLMGAIMLRANFRSCRIFQKMTEQEAVRLGLPAKDAFRYLRISGTKENYAVPPDKSTWFKLESQRLDNGTDRYPDGDNMGAAKPWGPPAMFAGMNGFELEAVFAAIDAGPHAKAKQAKIIPWVGRPLIEVGNRTDDQATKIVDAWTENRVLIPGEPYKASNRGSIQTLKTDPSKVAEILRDNGAASREDP
jgi:hypothetical protein